MSIERASRELLAAFLAANDAPCPVCAYNLRGVTTDHCPECGKEIELRIGSMDLRIGWWLAAILALAGAEGFFFILFALIPYNYRYYAPPLWEFLLIIGPLLFLGFGVFLLIRKRRHVWRWGRQLQIVLACFCFILAIALPTLFLASIV